MERIPRNIKILPSDEDTDCCRGYPNMEENPKGCPVCGCREAGNASYTCLKHYGVVNKGGIK